MNTNKHVTKNEIINIDVRKAKHSHYIEIEFEDVDTFEHDSITIFVPNLNYLKKLHEDLGAQIEKIEISKDQKTGFIIEDQK